MFHYPAGTLLHRELREWSGEGKISFMGKNGDSMEVALGCIHLNLSVSATRN